MVCAAATRAHRNKKLLGEAELTPRGDKLEVSFIETNEDYRRCGVGTRLYQAALAEACQRGLRLASDTTRTPMSEGFWAKQVRKGRASCTSTGDGAERLTETFRPSGKRWPCRQYAMAEVCPASTDLSGRRRRRRGR